MAGDEKTTRTLEEIKAELLASAEAGAFIGDVCNRRWSLFNGEFEIAVKTAAELHNERKHDFLSQFTEEVVEGLPKHSFFKVQHFFGDLLPAIDTEADKIIPLVAAMVRKAGADGAAGRPYSALREWAALDPVRPTAILTVMADDSKFDFAALAVGLHAGAMQDVEEYAAQAISLMDDPLRRCAAASALGKMDFASSPSFRDKALDALSKMCLPDSDDAECATALGAAIEIFVR